MRRQLRTVPCFTCGAMPTGIFVDGSPRYDHGHDPLTGETWWHPKGHAFGWVRACPACRHQHPVGTTCLECPDCGYGVDLTGVAAIIFEGDLDVYAPGSYPRFDDAEHYFWAAGCTDDGSREYHWFPDCAWLLVSLSHSGTLVGAHEPPAAAAERLPAADALARDDLPRLCRLCAQEWPLPEGIRPLTDDPCATCGCPQPSHVAPVARGARHWCRTVWTEVVPMAPGADDLRLTLLHCRCDRYRAGPPDPW